MNSEYIEVKCGNCRYWHPWKSFARKGELSVRRAIEEGEKTGCDGKCCCYEGREVQPGPRASWDTLSATYCNFYKR